eukprot:COSAG06_NODE_3794_length_4898_cov_43.804082_4_plen_159_part_00
MHCCNVRREHALREVKTPLVMVVQDDRCFSRRILGLRSLLGAISPELGDEIKMTSASRDDADVTNLDGLDDDGCLNSNGVGYVLLPTRKQNNYVARMRSVAGERGRKLQPDTLDLPLLSSDATIGAGDSSPRATDSHGHHAVSNEVKNDCSASDHAPR